MKKSAITCLLFAALAFQPLFAVPAKRGVIKTITQPDGTTIQVKQVGDEHFHFYTSVDDEPLLPDSQGFLRVVSHDEIDRVAKSHVSRKASQKNAISSLAASSDSPWSGVGLYGEQFPNKGDRNALIILVEYSDVKFKVKDAHDYFTRFLNEEGFSDDGGTGSARDYFLSVSCGQFNPTFDVYGPVTLGTRATYGGNDRYGDDIYPEGMVIEACQALDNEIDFSKYDTDGDKVVDNVYIIYAGQGEASYGPAESVWPHQWSLSMARVNLVLDGVKIDTYGCCNEWDYNRPDGIGTFCHEFGHVLGLPDLYSYSNSRNDQIATPGPWDIMDQGSYNNGSRTPPTYSVFERNAMGWIDLKKIEAGVEGELNELGETNEGYIYPVSNTEFFFFENRQKKGWDKYIPGHGMLIWHVRYFASAWRSNTVNETADKQYVDIEEACAKVNNNLTSTMAGYPFPGTKNITEFSDTTTPNMLSWAGKKSNLIVSNINESADGVITFQVKSATDGITDITTDDFTVGELYTLQGVKVNGAPSPGIYISKSGNEVKKIIIR